MLQYVSKRDLDGDGNAHRSVLLTPPCHITMTFCLFDRIFSAGISMQEVITLPNTYGKTLICYKMSKM